jgi:hypothetical protein
MKKTSLVKLGSELVIGRAGAPLKVDIGRLAETRLLVQASAGGGKSYTLRRLLETTHGQIQHLVIDTEGEFSSLRKSLDYVYIAKGESTAPDPATAGVLARSLLELGVSAIIDIYELHPRDRRRFVRYFLEGLVDSPKNLWHPVLVVLDEAHEYAPEQSESEALDAVVALAAKGRKRDMACVLATQRPAKLNKDVAAECQNKLIGLANLDIDRKRAGDDLGFRSKDEVLKLRDLEPGEFYALGPAFRLGEQRLKEPTKIQCDPVETPHGRTARRWRPAKAATSKDVKSALAALAKLPKQAEQEARDLESARARLKELDREIRELRKGQPKKDPDAEKRSFEAGRMAERKDSSKVAMQIKGLKNKLTAKIQELGILISQIPDVDQPAGVVAHTYPSAKSAPLPPPTPIRAPHRHAAPPALSDGEQKLSTAEILILQFLASRPGRQFSRVQIGVQIRRSRKSSSFDAAFPGLERKDLVTKQGLLYLMTPGQIAAAGAILGDRLHVEANDSPEDWLPKLKPAPRVVFEVLLTHRDRVFSREEISQLTGRSSASSSFDAAFPELERLGLLKKMGPGMVQFNSENFT